MVVVTPLLITLTGEVIRVLCGSTITFDGILARLQSVFPGSSWTTDLLTSVLASGKALGTFSAIGSYAGGPVTGYTINANAMRINYAFNKNFIGFCSPFSAVPCCNSASLTSGGSCSSC